MRIYWQVNEYIRNVKFHFIDFGFVFDEILCMYYLLAIHQIKPDAGIGKTSVFSCMYGVLI